jgi:hypothetical protein
MNENHEPADPEPASETPESQPVAQEPRPLALEPQSAPGPAPAPSEPEPATPRRFRLYREGRLALEIRDQPGIMVSTSAPPPLPGRGPVTHPFATATAYVAEWEGQLGAMLRGAPSFDAFLDEVAAAGYEIRRVTE